MDDIKVTLTWPEVMIAALVGSMRNVQCLRGNYRVGVDRGPETTWTPNIEGAAGEMAVAKHLNLYWSGNVGNLKADDVGPYQVRTNSSRRHEDMALRPRDKLDRVYICVLSFLPKFVICGWIAGADGKRDEWYRVGTPSRPACYFVPRSALRSLDDLTQPGAALPRSHSAREDGRERPDSAREDGRERPDGEAAAPPS